MLRVILKSAPLVVVGLFSLVVSVHSKRRGCVCVVSFRSHLSCEDSFLMYLVTDFGS